jgi:hypothetical protein
MTSPDPHLAELERLLKRDERGRAVGSSFAIHKLAPHVMAPPPDPGDLSADDLDPVEIEPAATARWVWIAGLAVAVLAAGILGWFFRPQEGAPAPTSAVVPPVAVPVQPPAPPAPQPTKPADAPASSLAVPASVAVVPPAPAVQPQAMPEPRPAAAGRIELVRPDTQGLSPARLVRAQVIVVRDDREVSATR